MLIFIVVAAVLLVAFVPMIFKLIETSKKEAFAKSIVTYIGFVKTAYSSEELECYSGDTLIRATAFGDGDFYVPITTAKENRVPKNYDVNNTISFDKKIPSDNSNLTIYDIAQENAKNIVGSNGKSPFGKDIYGYIKIVKTGFNTEYFVKIVDSAGNGNSKEENETDANLVKSIQIKGLKTALAPNSNELIFCKFAE